MAKAPDDPDGRDRLVEQRRAADCRRPSTRVGPRDAGVDVPRRPPVAGWWIRRRPARNHRAPPPTRHSHCALTTDLPPEPGRRRDQRMDRADDGFRPNPQAPPLPRGADTASARHRTTGLGPSGEWTIVNDEEGVGWSHDHGKGDAALRGPANDLLARDRSQAYRRPEGRRRDIRRHCRVGTAWLEHTPFLGGVTSRP